MSKRAEEAALKAHPICTHSGMIEKRRAERRRCHEEGYEQGERDTLERVLDYIGVNLHMRWDEKQEWIDEFKKAMEEEQ